MSAVTASSSHPPEEYLIFEDEFNTLDLNRWHHEITLGGGGNREFQAYLNRRRNSYVQNGNFVIRPTFTADEFGDDYVQHGLMNLTATQGCQYPSREWRWLCERQATPQDVLPPVLSAKVNTKDSFAFTYGRFEVRAKLPSADWTWPAVWLMPRDQVYGPWPKSGEIDLMESRGNVNYNDVFSGKHLGNDAIGSTLNWGPSSSEDAWPLSHSDKALEDGTTFSDKFHIFGLYWSDTELYTYLDTPDQVIFRVQDYGVKSFWDLGARAGIWEANDTEHNCWKGGSIHAPFDQAFYIIMNVAVGGTPPGPPYFPDNKPGKPWNNNDAYPQTNFYHGAPNYTSTWEGERATMKVDWVRVWGFRNLTTFTAKVLGSPQVPSPQQQQDEGYVFRYHHGKKTDPEHWTLSQKENHHPFPFTTVFGIIALVSCCAVVWMMNRDRNGGAFACKKNNNHQQQYQRNESDASEDEEEQRSEKTPLV